MIAPLTVETKQSPLQRQSTITDPHDFYIHILPSDLFVILRDSHRFPVVLVQTTGRANEQANL